MQLATPLLLLLGAALLTSTAFPAVCPNCGTRKVPYPLSTGPHCGDTKYKIRCHNNATLLFPSANNTYNITHISAKNQRLVIAPSNLNRTCVTADYPTNGLQLDESGPFNITGSNTIFFLNCNESIHRSPLNCSDISLCHVYANATDGANGCRNTTCCSFKAGGSTTAYRIQLRPQGGCKAYTSFVDLELNTHLPVSQWPKPSVQLEWLTPATGGTT